MDILYNLIMATFRQTTPILLAATGGVYSDRSGLANITLEASMIMGAFFAVYGSYTYGSSAVGILFGLIAGVVTGVLFALICLYMGGNNVVVGISFNLIAWGLTTFLLLAIYGTTGSFVSRKIVSMPKYTVPVLSGLPVIGGLFKSQTIVAYFSVLFVVITWFILFRTKEGMKIRACGENPQAAAAVGYDVRKIQFLCSVITSTACGLAGAHLSLGLVTLFAEKMTAGKGFIALAVVTFGGGSLWKVMAISGLFGLADAVSVVLKRYDYPSFLIQMIPYLVVVVFVAFDPAVKYFRERKLRSL
ncbi:ABC transporter permease [Enterocloster asparagiformis]|uniref:ABC transporter permease n=1 Tax=Enterocloster asparagiformis TaxID=333367 RepID=UPI0023553C5F